MNKSSPHKANTIKTNSDKGQWQQIALFTGITFAITYSSWIAFYQLHAAKGGRVFDDSPFGLLMLIGLFAPTLTAILLGIIFRHHGPRPSHKGSLQKILRFTPITIIFVSAYVLVDYTAAQLLSAIFIPSAEKALGTLPIALETLPTAASILSAFAMSIVFGGLEELGWRGYLLPRFLKLWSPLKATVILSCIWTLWHVPLFFIPGTAQASYSFVVFALSTFTLSAIMSWLWLKTQSTTIAVLAHTTFNAFAVLGITSGTSWVQVAVSAIFAVVSAVLLHRLQGHT